MGIPEIDQIKKSEQEAADLIEAARHRKKLVIEEAEREGEGLIALRLSDAEKRLRDEKEKAEQQVSEERSLLMEKAGDEAQHLMETALLKKNAATQRLVRLITGEDHVLSSPDE